MVNRRAQRSGRQNGRRRLAPVRRLGRMMHRQTKGFEIVPPNDPPAYVSAPWWPITAVFVTTSGDNQCTTANIRDQILAQLDFKQYKAQDSKQQWTVPIDLELRVLSVRAWGTGLKPIQLTIYDHLGGKHRIAEISDYGTSIHYSKCGWKFGSIGTSDALRITDSDVIFEVTGGSADNKVLVYVQTLVRTPNAPKPVLFRGNDIPALNRDLNDMVVV